MRRKILVVIDMQNDFITGSLGNYGSPGYCKRSKNKNQSGVETKRYSCVHA